MSTKDEQNALSALGFVIPLLTKRSFRWCITGGFACYVYGVKRELTDIDIDIDTSKDSSAFQDFVRELTPATSQPLEHFVDQNYDNYNFEITVNGQVVDICPMAEMKLFDKVSSTYQPFYRGVFPDIEVLDFFGLKLPLLSKELVIRNKEELRWQRESDVKDIEGLKLLIHKK